MYGITNVRGAAAKAVRAARTRVVGNRQAVNYQKLGFQQQRRNACGFSTQCTEGSPNSPMVNLAGFSSIFLSCMLPWGYFLANVANYQKRDDDEGGDN